jgi:hypothetical protein
MKPLSGFSKPSSNQRFFDSENFPQNQEPNVLCRSAKFSNPRFF